MENFSLQRSLAIRGYRALLTRVLGNISGRPSSLPYKFRSTMIYVVVHKLRPLKAEDIKHALSTSSDGDVQASALSLAYELSCFPGEPCGAGYLTFPEDALRDARVASTLLREAPQASASDVEAVMALQVGAPIVLRFVGNYRPRKNRLRVQECVLLPTDICTVICSATRECTKSKATRILASDHPIGIYRRAG